MLVWEIEERFLWLYQKIIDTCGNIAIIILCGTLSFICCNHFFHLYIHDNLVVAGVTLIKKNHDSSRCNLHQPLNPNKINYLEWKEKEQ